MYSKALVMVLLAVVTAAGLLTLRQRRIKISHDLAVLHDQIHEARYVLWDMQTSIAEKMNPQSIQASIVRAQLELEPIVSMSQHDVSAMMLAVGKYPHVWLKTASP